MSLPTLIFDLDGTLVDSAGDLAGALNVLLAEDGRPELSVDETRSLIGGGAQVLILRAWKRTGEPLDPARLETLYRRFLEIYQDRLTALTRVYPEVVETLERLRDAGFTMGVCTNKPITPTLTILDSLDLKRFFGAVLGGDSLPWKKPDPRHVTAVVDALDGRGKPAILVGDSAIDVAAGHAADLPVIAVTWGYARSPLVASDAEAAIDLFSALPEAIEDLQGRLWLRLHDEP
ncbi:MAG: phosphoglycolate phosphatase [Deltaproteobacteria bacterium]|nr:phosphoglycolate phosphatase [Deltaproteobacteria bacterium]MBW2256552.1 phosphoglycolate phosphatase [Deltaproteobacteria bacterium]